MALSTASIFEDIRLIDEKIAAMNLTKTDLLNQAAYQSCPYKKGQIVVTNTGLGTNGLEIQNITHPTTPSYPDNLWKLETFAVAKDGSVSRRYVSVEHRAADTYELKVKA